MKLLLRMMDPNDPASVEAAIAGHRRGHTRRRVASSANTSKTRQRTAGCWAANGG